MTSARIETEKLLEKIIGFQTEILNLKRGVKSLQTQRDHDARSAFLEQTEWFDSIGLVIQDIQAGDEIARAGLLRALGRLRNRMRRFFEKNSVTAIEASHSQDDADCVKVLETRPAPGAPDGAILETIRQGYRWKGEVLRKAEVISAKNPA